MPHPTTRTRPRGGRARHAQRERDATDGTGGTEPRIASQDSVVYGDVGGIFSCRRPDATASIIMSLLKTSEERTYAYERRHIECDSRTSRRACPDAAELPALCGEIRTTLVRYGHVHGGHIGSNLGMVEATVALHRVFDSPRDRIVFDVSHQSYVHKMLTGRADAYLDPAHHDSVTGFTNPDESAHDQFVLGHTGTSISLACGLAKSRDLTGGMDGGSGIRNVIAVIGDGSLSSAIAFEGLNNAAEQGGNLIIIVNDNEMSIAEDHGGMYGTLARLRATGGKGGPNLLDGVRTGLPVCRGRQ